MTATPFPTVPPRGVEPAHPAGARAAGGPLTPDALGARFVTPPDPRPLLFVVVDTEEEFDWNAPLSRQQTAVRAMRALERGHVLLRGFGVRPTYVIDYPVATRPDGYRPVLDLVKDGSCAIGAHLHPWVTPPHLECVTGANSYGCNLPAALERAKIERLRDAVAERFGAPRAFKAGRYGFGRSTAAALDALAFDVDLSINPTLRPTADGGPSFAAFDSRPFLFGRRPLLELPCTHDYVGRAGRFRRPLHRAASGAVGRRLRAPAVLARAGLVNHVMLSPESSSLTEMIALATDLHRQGLTTFSLTFHSPSLEPGHTPYVRSAIALVHFLDRIRGFCDFFFGTLGGACGTPAEFRLAALASRDMTS